MRRAAALLAAALLAVAALPGPAAAHGTATGFGPFLDGVAHLALSPADLLVVLGAGLVAGLGGAAGGRALLVALPLGWAGGSLLGLAPPAAAAATLSVPAALVAIGGLAALDPPLGQAGIAAATGLAGLAAGLGAGVDPLSGRDALVALAGTVAAVAVLAALVPAALVGLVPPGARIALRVLGSWIAAIGILMAGRAVAPAASLAPT